MDARKADTLVHFGCAEESLKWEIKIGKAKEGHRYDIPFASNIKNDKGGKGEKSEREKKSVGPSA